MKARLYWSYATRSLLRGGQRTLLAIFCVAVGVMAIVGLQLVGNAVNGALTSNVRNGNGGDVSVRSDINPLTTQQLKVFSQLQADGTITRYTAISEHDAQTITTSGGAQFYIVRAVNPTQFPISGAPIFTNPASGNLASILAQPNTAVVTDTLRKHLGVQVGDMVTVETNDGYTLHLTIGGIIADSGLFAQAQMITSLGTIAAAPNSAGLPLTYTVVYANVPGHTDANAAAAKTAISRALPLATVTTTKDALQNEQSQVQQIRYFLQIVGLLALLIGGVGIMNTMQVLLRRRQTEIAMLKTAGYRQRDLFVLFGVEAAVLGILGGVVGAAAGIGAGALVERLVEQLFFLTLPSGFSWGTVGAGVAIGFFTALIFGLIPIVQASQIRPLAVLRGQSEGTGRQSTLLSLVLSALLAVLFFLLALSILQNVALTAAAVVGTGIFLLILSGIFTAVVLVVSRLPVPERLTWWFALLVLAGLLVAGAVTVAVPAFGILFLVIALLGLVVVVLPRTAKANVKMALRNLGRQPGRTVTTMVALFIGIFAIGLILVLGQNIENKINSALNADLQYNSVVIAGPTTKAAVDAELSKLASSIKGEQLNTAAFDTPLSINGVSVAQLLTATKGNVSNTRASRQEVLSYLSTVEGYSLSGASGLPQVTIARGAQDSALGRNLSAADSGSDNAILPVRASLAPLDLKLGDKVTLLGPSRKIAVTLTIVGFYEPQLSLSGNSFYASDSVTKSLTAGKPYYIYQLKVDPKQSTQVLNEVQAAVPSVQTFSVAEITILVNSLLNNLIVMLTAIASLAMIAGIIIIANAVALAMLERRRELGILKSVGYTSRSVLSEVLMENGTVGFLGSLLAMLLVTFALVVLGKLVFNTSFGFGIPVVIGLVAATSVVCMLISGFVAWSATRVRPLAVLRYE